MARKRKARLQKVIDDFEIRLTFSNTGLPIKNLYDVEAEYEKYFVVFSNKNYFLYYIDDKKVYVMEMYDEREDYARDMFGIIATTQGDIGLLG